MFEPRKRQRAPIAWSIGIHVVAIAMNASITFRYPISSLFGPRPYAVDTRDSVGDLDRRIVRNEERVARFVG